MLGLALLAAGAAIASAAVPGDLPVWARGGKMYSALQSRMNASGGNTTANYFNQEVDHNDESKGTFRQKYYLDSSYAKSDQVVLYISGEGPLGSSPTGSVVEFAEQQGALLIALEHRWYGESIPGDIRSTADLSTLTVDQAMEDIRSFIQLYNMADGAKTWTVVGGSYAGALSSWARQKNGDIISASWSSSGVVEAIFEFTAFDKAVVSALSPSCLSWLQDVTAAMDASWPIPSARASMLQLFGTPSDFTQADFAWMMADAAAMGVQYGFKDQMCSYMPSDSSETLQAFSKFVSDHYGSDFGSSCYYSSACLSDPSRFTAWYDVKTWIYQCCSTLAYWQVAYPGSLRSSVITTDYFTNQCEMAFGTTLPLNVTSFNLRYGGNDPVTLNVAASQGSDDPWRMAGVQQTLGPLYQVTNATCDGCGHCRDLHAPDATDPQTIVDQRKAIMGTLAKWLA